jgi:hypothetical protein
VYWWDLLDVTVGDSAAVLKLLAHVDEALLVGEGSLPVVGKPAEISELRDFLKACGARARWNRRSRAPEANHEGGVPPELTKRSRG